MIANEKEVDSKYNVTIQIHNMFHHLQLDLFTYWLFLLIIHSDIENRVGNWDLLIIGGNLSKGQGSARAGSLSG